MVDIHKFHAAAAKLNKNNVLCILQKLTLFASKIKIDHWHEKVNAHYLQQCINVTNTCQHIGQLDSYSS